MKAYTRRANTWFGIALLATALVVLSSPLASAQTLTGSIVGQVVDPDGLPIPGVTILLESPQLVAGQMEVVTQETGRYRFSTLPSGTYSVIFSLSGFKNLQHEGINISAGSTATLDAALSIAEIEETITVTGESPLVDVKSSQVREVYSQNLIENIPTSREYVDIYHMVPGVEDGQYRELTPGASSINGGSNRDNRINLEGANLNDALVVNVASDISYEVVQEVQVVTGGIAAEFGGVTAGVVNVVTKSGGNNFSGSAYYYQSNEDLQSNNVTPELIAKGLSVGTALTNDLNFGASVGGPVMKNRLWFFGNFDRKSQDETIINFPLPVEGRQNIYFGKLTAQLSEGHKLTGLFQYRARNDFPFIPQSRLKGDTVQRSQDHTNNIFYGAWTAVLSENTFIEVKGNTSNQRRNQDFPFADDCEVGKFPNPCDGYEDRATRDRFGPWYRAVVHPGNRNTREFKLDGSHYAFGLEGTHDIKFGGVYDLLYVDEMRTWKNGARQHQLYRGAPYRIVLSNNPIPMRGNVGTIAAYAQDQWSLNDNLTLSLGLRVENHEVWVPAGSSGGENFAKQEFPQQDLVNTNTFSPRLGFAYDLLGDGTTVLKANAGRYYAQIYASPFYSVARYAQGAKTYDWNDLNGDFVYQAGEEGQLRSDSTHKELASVDPNLKVPYWDTFTVGVDRELSRDFRFSVTGVYRKSFDAIETVDASRPFDEAYEPITLTNPLTGQPITIYALDPAYSGIPSATFITNPDASYCSFCEDIVQDYRGLQFTFEKRLRNRWQLYGSYVLSAAKGNKGTHHRTSGRSLYGNPNRLVNATGATTLSRTHSLKVQGTYHAPYDVWLSFNYQAQTGLPYQQDRGALGPEVRFVRADSPLMIVESRIDVFGLPPGEKRLESRHLIDVRAEKRFELGDRKWLGMVLDIRNVLNAGYTNFVEDVLITDSDYNVPGSIVFARTFRLGARFEF